MSKNMLGVKEKAELVAMELSERKAAVADDLKSRRDKYAVIGAVELAALLGIDEARYPGTGNAPWSFFRLTEISIGEYLEENGSFLGASVVDALAKVLTKERLSEIEVIVESNEFSAGFDEAQLTEEERNIIRAGLHDEAIENGMGWTICRSGVSTDDGFDLIFEGGVEDDGTCLGLQTPYDHRDGTFFDLDNRDYEEW